MYRFCLVNARTTHVLNWFKSSPAANLESLIARSFELVEHDEWFEMGIDPSTVAKDKLAELLREKFTELALEYGLDFEDDCETLEERSAEEYGHVNTLFEPLERDARQRTFRKIAWEAIAQFLLIGAGKWAPDRELPECI